MEDWTKEVDVKLSIQAEGLLLPEEIGTSDEESSQSCSITVNHSVMRQTNLQPGISSAK